MNEKSAYYSDIIAPENAPDTGDTARELAGAEIDARFWEGLENGTIIGDVVIVDEHGNIIGGLPDHSIFDL